MAATAQAAATQAGDRAKQWWGRAKVATGLAEEIDEEAPNSSLLSSFNEATTLNKTQVSHSSAQFGKLRICNPLHSRYAMLLPTSAILTQTICAIG